MFKKCIIVLVAAVSCWLTACDDYDSFTTDRTATLQFSSDSIIFDTLLTTVPSSTKTLAIYNRGDRGVRISEAWLEGGANSPFRLNIDGQDMSRSAANRIGDFDILRRDSIIVRAEVTLPEFATDEPSEVSDALVLRLESGVEQRVPLVVVGRNAFFLRAHTLLSDTTFTQQRPIVVYDSLVVGTGATLTLAPGTQLLFHDGASLCVHGSLVADGTVEQPVVMRTDRTDHIFDYLPYDRLPGRWGGLHLFPESHDNRLSGLDLHGSTYGILVDPPAKGVERSLTLAGSRLHNIQGNGLDATDALIEVSNTEISNTLGHCVTLLGGDATFTFCTLAQFYPLSAQRGNALDINAFGSDSTAYYHPLHRAHFEGCVVTGYADDVIIIPDLNSDHWPTSVVSPVIEFSFNQCFLTTVIPEGSTPEQDYSRRFTACVLDDLEADLNREHHFRLLDTHAFLYDFTPVEESPIRGIAPSAASTFPVDRLGHSRTADNAPDAGCYEFVATSSK